MAHWSVVASLFVILPPPLCQFCSLAPYCHLSWHLTALPPPWLAPYCYLPADTLLLLTGWHPTSRWLRSCHHPLRSTQSSSVTPSHGVALPRWVPPMPWSHHVIADTTIYGYDVGPHSCGFHPTRNDYPLPQASVSVP